MAFIGAGAMAQARGGEAEAFPQSFWRLPLDELFSVLGSGPGGLDSNEVERRLRIHGPSSLAKGRRSGPAGLLLRQFTSPIILILTGAA